jgi:tetratricopeptide (TPR) repeat protein
MKTFKAFSTIILFLVSIPGLVSWKNYEKPLIPTYPKPSSGPITMCGSFPADWPDTTEQAKILPGLGNLHYRITTRSPEAQAFFEQGLRLVYGFNHWEAIRAFREATRLDPDCAMAYWGLALAYGPNLNDVNPADREKIAFESIQKAVVRKAKITAVEKDLIDAMAARYNGKSYATRDSLNKTYADAMVKLAKRYPNDAEALTLCADAIMNTMPWDYWLKDGSPKPETQQAKIILEDVLKKFPEHAGAHHLYIHLVEASPRPELGLPSAKFLEDAMPGAGHIVHMPAHIYVRTGQYDRSISLNQRAVMVDEDYLSNSTNRGMYRWMYYPHNVDFISYSSYMDGRSNLGIQTAMKLAYKGGLIANSNPSAAQYFMVEPLHAFVRFGKWNDILSLPDPDNTFVYAKLMSHFAKGLAFIRTNQAKQATGQFSKLDSLCKLDTLKSIYFSFNSASEIVQVPLNLLKGELLIRQNKIDEGITFLRKAVATEDNLRYMEPPDWKIPTRQFLGAALLESGKFAEAEKIYSEDLQRNPENGWSLKGLLLCQEKTGKKAEASVTAKRLAKAWKNADVTLTASRF